MKILHTSDWHLGSSLCGHKRYEESEDFLIWLDELIRKEHIDAVVVSGDIFDTGTPGNRAQELYYQFLNRVTAVPGLQAIVTAGNHDSPSLLDAPQALLKHLRIHVYGSITEHAEDEIVEIADREGLPSLIVCAVPYLRDRDIRLSEPGESIEDKTRKMEEGVQSHYRQVIGLARKKHEHMTGQVPIVAMGHLFVSGGKTVLGDGVRELYVGNLARIRAETLCDGIDYLALGHLHVPQKVSGKDTIRYCGSPIALGFEDAGQQKLVVIVEFGPGAPVVSTVPVPKFRDVRTLKGDLSSIEHEIGSLINLHHSVWLEVLFSGSHSPSAVQVELRELTKGTEIEILRIRPLEDETAIIVSDDTGETLEDLSETEVFRRCMEAGDIPEEDRKELTDAFAEILQDLHEEDTTA
jgi:DNA repair protein SbcD/Mre11